MLSTYKVTTTSDNTSQGSLRWAITQVDNDTSPDTIDFALSGSGLQTITLSSSLGALPTITNPVLIDGTSQSGYSGTPLIAINGSNLPSTAAILSVTAGSSTIQGLAIVGCPGAGILLETGGNNLVQACYIGTPNGTSAEGNGVGIEIFGSAGNTIGGSTASARNVVSASTSEGLAVGDSQASENNLIEGNYIGLDWTGSVGMGNGQNGLLLDHAAFNTISGNAVAANTGDGILIQQLSGTSTTNTIANNEIGTSASGIEAIPNTTNGIELNGVSMTTISGNIISGNTQNGVLLDSGTTATDIQSNDIGTNPAGTLPQPNGGDGIQTVSASGVTIGGDSQGAGNLISGNKGNGIQLAATNNLNDTGVIIEGNIIGLNAAGTATLANGNSGIDQNGSDGTTIGGTTSLTRNIISGNSSDGISMGTGNNSVVEGNYIGTDITGTKALGNGTGLNFANASYATIGGTVIGSGNVISGNTQNGINCFVIGSSGEVIEGNYIGVDSSGVRALGNGSGGVRIAGPTDCTIGGTVASAANVISGNNGDGLAFTVGPANGTIVEGNYIGTDANGDNLGNNGNGATVWSDQVTIGGTAAGAGNVIAFNQKQGIALVFSVNDNSFLSNSIYDNAGLGISLGDESGEDTPTPNHPNEQGFTLPQANDFQNYPVLASAVVSQSTTEVTGTLNAGANTSYLVQFFASPAADPSGYGPGQLYLGSTTVTTNSNYNASFDVVVPVGAPAGWVISATATDPLGNTSEFSEDVNPEVTADVGVAVAASPSPAVYAGATLTYTVTVSNSGPDLASGVTVTDTLPQNIGSHVTATTSVPGVTPVISNGTVTADLGTMAANASATLTITVQPTGAAVPQITDQVSVTSNSMDSNPSNNSASVTTTVNPAADVALTIQGSPNPAPVGGTVTYVLTATNAGPSVADDVVVTDTLPSNIGSNVTATTSIPGVTPTIANGQVTADLGTLSANGTATVTITVQPTVAAIPQISDNASVTSSTYDPNTSNNSPPTLTITVEPAADLQVSISPSANPIPVGQDLTYSITATNNGPSTATSVIVTDTIPGGVTFVSATGGATPSNGVLTFNLGTLAANASTILSVVVAASGTTPSPLSDGATISSPVYDPNPNNNTATTSVPVTPVSNLSVAMSGSPNPDYVGTNILYVMTASNSGPSTDPAAVLTDTLPAGVTFVSATGGVTPSGGVLTFNLGSLAANAKSTVDVVVTPTTAGSITNTAVVTGKYNANPQNSNSVTTSVNAESGLILQIAAPATATVGQGMTYTVMATDDGPSNATGVIVIDTLPADITSNVTATTSVSGVIATIANGQVTANFGNVNNNASVTLTITVVPTLAAVTASPLVNSASVSANEYDPNPNTATSSVPINPVSQLSIGMTGSASQVYVGSNLTFTLTATNSGPSTDPAVTVSDTLPTNVTFVSATGGVTPSDNVLNFNLGSMVANASRTLTIVVNATAASVGTITNSAVINGKYNDNAQNSTSLNTTVLAKVTPVITWSNPADITYLTALSATQLDATTSVDGSWTYTPALGTVLLAGSRTLSVLFTPTDGTEYNSPTATVSINVDPAVPIITWTNPADITYGTGLSATQLDATASVPGTLTYSPGLNTKLAAGSRTLSVQFTPTDGTDYTPATATVTINVDKATPTINWPNPADITYGTALSSTQLDATSPVPGTFTYSQAGQYLNAGSDQTLSVTFTPTDSADYVQQTTVTTSINVEKATPKFQLTAPGGSFTGGPFPASVMIGGSGQDSSFSASLGGTTPTLTYYSGSSTSGMNLGSTAPTTPGNYTVVAGFAGNTDYAAVQSSPVTFTISPGTAAINLSASSGSAVYGQSVALTAKVTGVITPTGTVTFQDDGTTIGTVALDGTGTATFMTSTLAAGSHSITAIYDGNADFASAQSGATSESITKSVATLSLMPQPTMKKKKVVSETLTARITPTYAGGSLPTGTVIFEVTTKKGKKTQTKVVGTAQASGGTASVTVNPKLVLSQSITVIYSGDSNFQNGKMIAPKLPKSGL